MLFLPGTIVATAGALDVIPKASICSGIARHLTGDWGDICEEDRKLNDQALRDGTRLLSAYHTPEGIKFWIITEADRSATTVLLPEEY